MAAQPVDPIVPSEAPNLSNRALKALLKKYGACGEARDAIGNRDARTAWGQSERGDHMLWLSAKVGVDRRLLARAAVACVQPVITAYVPADEPRPQAALDATLRWCDDPTEANLELVREARRAAVDAVDAAYAAYDAAAYAAYAAVAAAAYAAYADAADAADAAYAAAAYAAAAAVARREARVDSLRRSAVIVREHIPFEVVLAAAGVRP